jgi:hypothetical protein
MKLDQQQAKWDHAVAVQTTGHTIKSETVVGTLLANQKDEK